jgi:5-methylcytosine-specific restriction protein A
MPKGPSTFSPFGDRGQSYEEQRGGASKRLYDYWWQKERKTFLEANPLCVMCRDEGIVTAACIVDHIKPHRGDIKLFRDRSNWQALCKDHHDSTKQRQERRGRGRGGSKV